MENDPGRVSIEELVGIIGRKEVELYAASKHVARLQARIADLEKEPVAEAPK